MIDYDTGTQFHECYTLRIGEQKLFPVGATIEMVPWYNQFNKPQVWFNITKIMVCYWTEEMCPQYVQKHKRLSQLSEEQKKFITDVLRQFWLRHIGFAKITDLDDNPEKYGLTETQHS